MGRGRAVRLLAFGGVLVLTTGMLAMLFEEAQAIGFTITNPGAVPTTSTTSATFRVDVTIQGGQFLPIDAVRATLERTATTTKVDPTTIAVVRCDDPLVATGCPPDPVVVEVGTAGVFTAVTFVGAAPTAGITAYGRRECTVPDPCTVIEPGYGYRSGIGYGYEFGGQEAYTVTTGYAYGYATADLVLQFDVTINPSAIGVAGTYWLTFIVDTGTVLVGEVSSLAQQFTISATGPTGGPSGGGGTPPGPPGAPPIAPPTSPLNPGQSATAPLSGNAGTTLTLNGLLGGSVSMSLTLAQTCTGCTLSISTSSAPPAGTPGLGEGFTAVIFLNINVLSSTGTPVSGAISGGTMQFAVDPADLPPGATVPQLIMLRLTPPPLVLDPTLVSVATADPLVFQVTLPSFSVFAIAIDTAPPTITAPQPADGTTVQNLRPTIRASWSDNRRVDEGSAIVQVDGAPVTVTATATGFTYVPARDMAVGEHTVIVTVQDASELPATTNWRFNVARPSAAVGQVTGLTALAGAGQVTLTWDPVPGAVMYRVYRDGEMVAEVATTTYTDTGLVGGTEYTYTVTAVDVDGNEGPASEPATATPQAEGEEPPEERRRGIPGWVFAVILVVLILAVAAFYVIRERRR